jgi:hypothetical protein
MTDHLSWDMVNDLAGDQLDPSARRAATAHIESCPECRDAFDVLRRTLSAVRELPQSIDPPAELWSSIRESIDASKVTVLNAGVGRRAPWWASPRRLAVAATALVVASSALTALVMRSPGDSAGEVVTAPARVTAMPVVWQAAERGYLASVNELHDLLDEQRTTLAPSTVSTVERSLAIIDAAIAEARTALLEDPANAALADLLASNYRQKVELLRRATQLEPRT